MKILIEEQPGAFGEVSNPNQKTVGLLKPTPKEGQKVTSKEITAVIQQKINKLKSTFQAQYESLITVENVEGEAKVTSFDINKIISTVQSTLNYFGLKVREIKQKSPSSWKVNIVLIDGKVIEFGSIMSGSIGNASNNPKDNLAETVVEIIRHYKTEKLQRTGIDLAKMMEDNLVTDGSPETEAETPQSKAIEQKLFSPSALEERAGLGGETLQNAEKRHIEKVIAELEKELGGIIERRKKRAERIAQLEARLLQMEIEELETELEKIIERRKKRADTIAELEAKLLLMEDNERIENNTDTMSAMLGKETVDEINKHYPDTQNTGESFTKILDEIAREDNDEKVDPKDIKSLLAQGDIDLVERIEKLNTDIDTIEEAGEEAQEERKYLSKLKLVAEQRGLPIEKILAKKEKEDKKTNKKESPKTKKPENKTWAKIKGTFRKVFKYSVIAGHLTVGLSSMWVAGAGWHKVDEKGDITLENINWDYDKVVERTFSPSPQRALEQMKKAAETMIQEGLEFYNEEIAPPKFTMPIERLDMQSFKGSKETRCMGYILDALVKEGFSREINNLHGNAWTYSENAIAGGATKVYSIYDNHKDKPITYNQKKVKGYFEKNCLEDANKEYNIESFKHGDLISLYYPDSHNFAKAFKGGNGKFHTHAGIIIEENGNKYLVHTVTKNRRKDPLEKVLAGKTPFKVVEIIRPDYYSAKNRAREEARGVDVSEFVDCNTGEVEHEALVSETAYKLMATLEANKNTIQRMFNLSDQETNDILKLSMAVFNNESTFGVGPLYKKEKARETQPTLAKVINSPKQIIKEIADLIGYDDESKGMGQIKEEITLREYRKLFEGMDKHSIEYAAAATPFILASIHNQLKDYCAANSIFVPKSDLLIITGCIYNRGWDNYEKPVLERLQEYKKGQFSLEEYRKLPYAKKIIKTQENIEFNFNKKRVKDNYYQNNKSKMASVNHKATAGTQYRKQM